MKRTRVNQAVAPDLLVNRAGWVLFGLLVVLVVRYQLHLLNYIEWADESETVLTAKLIARGATLYFDVFNHHGPLTFLPGLLVEQVGNFGVSGHRVPIMIAQWLALAALFFSPLIRDSLVARIYTGLVATALVLYWPELFGHMYKYQVLAGLMLMVILAQYSLPAIACPERISPARTILCNLLIGSLPFLAITYLPASALLFAAGCNRARWKLAALAVLAAIALNLVFLGSFGSFAGYFAYHIYLNIAVLPDYIGGGSLLQMIDSIYRSSTLDLWRFMIFVANALAVARLASREPGLPWRSLLVAGALASLLLRVGDLPFHDMPYYYASLALPLLLIRRSQRLATQSALVIGAVLAVCLVKVSLLVPGDRQRLEARAIPYATEFTELARALTTRDERIIAYTFNVIDYLLADRLPASGNFFYFPWQKTYNENPVLGIQIDTCAEIRRNRPKVVLLDHSLVLGRFPWDSYGGCVQAFVDEAYTRVLDKPFYVRRDLSLEAIGVAAEGQSYEIRDNETRTADTPYGLIFGEAPTGQLKRLGVALRETDGSPGDVELHLVGSDGATARGRPSEHQHGLYWRFDIPPQAQAFDSAALAHRGEGDFTVLESHSEHGERYSCLVYEYRDGSRRFTPGCPLH